MLLSDLLELPSKKQKVFVSCKGATAGSPQYVSTHFLPRSLNALEILTVNFRISFFGCFSNFKACLILIILFVGGVSGHSSPVKALTDWNGSCSIPLSVMLLKQLATASQRQMQSCKTPMLTVTTHKDCATCHICIHLSSITIWICGSPHAMFVYHTIDSFATLWAQHSNPCRVCGSLQILRDLHNCDIISSVPQEMEFVTLPSPNLALAEQNQYLRLQKLYSTKWFDQKRKILGGLRGVLNWQNRGLQFNLLIWSVRLYMAVDLNSCIYYSTNGHSSRIRKIYSRILGEPHVYLPRGSHVKIAR